MEPKEPKVNCWPWNIRFNIVSPWKHQVLHGLNMKHCYSIPWMRSKWMCPKNLDLLLIWGPVLWWLSGWIGGIPCAHTAEVSDIPAFRKSRWLDLWGLTGWSKQVNIYVLAKIRNRWEFQDPKMEVPTIYKAYFLGLCKWISPQFIWPYIVKYLHFRILKFPFKGEF